MVKHIDYNDIDLRLLKSLMDRGIKSPCELDRFFNPLIENITPISMYSGALDAAKRIKDAISVDNRILIYGDYDCDGVCSVSILYMCLKSLGANVIYYIPSRHNDGYGINIDAVIKLQIEHKPDLLITVDCGISSHSEIKYIKDNLNIEVIVTDHHIPPEKLPECIIFNPKCSEGFSDLSGAGVVLRLVEALAGRDEMLRYTDIAAISTIADVVPLVGDNRDIVSYGIECMIKNPRRGIKFLAEISKAKFTASDIAYKIAPRINASGRLSDANKVVELFISEDYFLLRAIVTEIDCDNRDRRVLSELVYCEALELLTSYDLINNAVIVLTNASWDIGVLGIAAARLAREFSRPCILLTTHEGLLKGSGRSVKEFNLYESLSHINYLFLSFGGHSQAVGLSIEQDKLDVLIEQLNKNLVYIEDKDIPAIELDTLDIKIFHDLMKLEPFGCGNVKPQFIYNVSDKFKIINNTSHIKSKINGNVEIIGFNLINYLGLINSGITAKFTLDLNINKYNAFGQAIINNIEYQAENREYDYLSAQFIKQYLYKDTIERNIKYIDSLDQLDIISDYGTLFIASSLKTCYNVIHNSNNTLNFSILSKATLNPVNTIILSPLSNNVSRYYKRIVFLDKPNRMGYVERFINSTVKEIYIINSKSSIDVVLDKELLLSIKDTIIDIVKAFKVRCIDDLYYKVLAKIECSYLEFAVIFYILYEQKIIIADKNFNITVINRDLNIEESKLYRSINERD